ncbi:MAG: hypothetical protein KDC53_14115 [Saprospiraceae bacterium]|nr:hypothetical protein [Saprospiraceae bacterium]
MSNSDRSNFERLMNQDDDLKAAVDKMRLITDALELDIENELRAHLNSLRPIQKDQIKSRPLKRMVWYVAAAIVMMLVTFVWLLTGQKQGLDYFVSSHYVAYSQIHLRSEDDITDKIVGSKNSPLTESIHQFEEHLISDPQDYESRFILADLYKQNQNIDQAREEFLNLANSTSKIWKERAGWNYVLLSAQDKWNQNADEILKSILKDQRNSYHELGIELAKKMGKL